MQLGRIFEDRCAEMYYRVRLACPAATLKDERRDSTHSSVLVLKECHGCLLYCGIILKYSAVMQGKMFGFVHLYSGQEVCASVQHQNDPCRVTSLRLCGCCCPPQSLRWCLYSPCIGHLQANDSQNASFPIQRLRFSDLEYLAGCVLSVLSPVLSLCATYLQAQAKVSDLQQKHSSASGAAIMDTC